MKLRTVGQKIMNFGTSLGHKINKGVRSLGQKVYDNRYKILAGVGAMGAAAAMGGLAQSFPTMNSGSTVVPSDYTGYKLSDTLKSKKKLTPPDMVFAKMNAERGRGQRDTDYLVHSRL